jgi:hypothetical protein
MVSIEDVILIFSSQLGLVHRLISLVQQQVNIYFIELGVKGNTQTCGNLETDVAKLHWLRRSSQ